MTLLDYWQSLSPPGKEAFAARCKTSPKYISHIATGYRKASMQMAIVIERESHGQVQAESLILDADWEYLRLKFGQRHRRAA